MDRRLEFQDFLENLLGSGNVYFQPTQNTRMEYPAIVYELADLDARHANNDPYTIETAYSVTHIDRDPDSDVPMKLAYVRKSGFDRKFVADNLNHTVFNIYY